MNAVNLLTPRFSEIHFTSVTDRAPLSTYLHKGLNNLKASVDGHCHWYELRTKFPFYCYRNWISDTTALTQLFARKTEFSATATLTPLLARLGDSSSMISKADRIASEHAFIFHFCSFMSVITLKSYMF
jgi:hypothetical protein